MRSLIVKQPCPSKAGIVIDILLLLRSFFCFWKTCFLWQCSTQPVCIYLSTYIFIEAMLMENAKSTMRELIWCMFVWILSLNKRGWSIDAQYVPNLYININASIVHLDHSLYGISDSMDGTLGVKLHTSFLLHDRMS